jgi:major type 1 subunit fimbrin (pilin)
MIDRQPEWSAPQRRSRACSRTASTGSRILGVVLYVFALLALVGAGRVYAYDGTITFSGTFLQPSCTIDSSVANQTINLGSAAATDFAAVGSTMYPQAFNMVLTSCAPGTTVSMTVSGTMDTVSSVLKNTGTASAIGVQLLQASSVNATTGTPLTLNTAINLGTVNSTNTMTIPMVASFYRLGTISPGTVAATATVNFTYN